MIGYYFFVLLTIRVFLDNFEYAICGYLHKFDMWGSFSYMMGPWNSVIPPVNSKCWNRSQYSSQKGVNDSFCLIQYFSMYFAKLIDFFSPVRYFLMLNFANKMSFSRKLGKKLIRYKYSGKKIFLYLLIWPEFDGVTKESPNLRVIFFLPCQCVKINLGLIVDQ